jgi:hypothetical protein
MIAVIGGVLLLVASAAFLTIPYSLGSHPGEVVAMEANQQDFHPT